MEIAIDEAGVVRLVGSALPEAWNGLALKIHTLSKEQEAAYAALPEMRSGTRFEGGAFVAIE